MAIHKLTKYNIYSRFKLEYITILSSILDSSHRLTNAPWSICICGGEDCIARQYSFLINLCSKHN